MKNREWLVPLTGVAFVVLLIVGFIVGGEPPDADEPAQEIVDFYVDDKDSVKAGAYITGVAAVFFIFFANYLRTLFRPTATSAAILAGAVIFITGGAIDATLSFAMAEAAEDIEPESLVALQALWDNDFIPFMVGLAVFLIALAVSMLRTDVLPRWLGWVTLVLAVLAITPVGFFAFPLSGLLVLFLSVWLAMRARRAGSPPPPAGVPPAQ